MSGRKSAAHVEKLTLENRRLHDEARTDVLTGLRNTRALVELEGRKLGDPDCAWSSAGVLFVDVDCFGKYNHRYGDSAGDRALRAVAQALVRASRNSDLVFRKGGEELVVVVPEVDLSAALVVAQRVHRAVEALQIPHADSEVSSVLTVTVGVDCGSRGDRIEDLRERASALVMDAKRTGQRNRVHARLR